MCEDVETTGLKCGTCETFGEVTVCTPPRVKSNTAACHCYAARNENKKAPKAPPIVVKDGPCPDRRLAVVIEALTFYAKASGNIAATALLEIEAMQPQPCEHEARLEAARREWKSPSRFGWTDWVNSFEAALFGEEES